MGEHAGRAAKLLGESRAVLIEVKRVVRISGARAAGVRVWEYLDGEKDHAHSHAAGTICRERRGEGTVDAGLQSRQEGYTWVISRRHGVQPQRW